MKITAWLKRISTVSMVAAAWLAAPAHGAQWPTDTITLVVPFAPGGNTDIVGRQLADGLSRKLGVSVVVDNRSGATGMVGTNYVMGQPADGRTFLLSTISITISPHLFKSVPIDIAQRLTPIAQVSSVPKVLVVHPSLPVASMSELIAYAGKQDVPLTYGSSGVGSAHHLSGELFQLQENIKLTHVPYRGGGPALSDLAGNQIHMVFDDVPPSTPLLRAGKLKALAVMSTQRSPLLPDVPTVGEQGYKNFVVEPWYGLFGPKGLPAEIVTAMDAAVRDVVTGDAFQEAVLKMGGYPRYQNTADFTRFIADEHARWGQVVQQAKLEKE